MASMDMGNHLFSSAASPAGRFLPNMAATDGWLRSLKRFILAEERAQGGRAAGSSKPSSSAAGHVLSAPI